MQWMLALACLLLLASCGGDESPPRSPPSNCPPSAEENAMLAAVNHARASARACGSQQFAAAPALQWSCALANAARQHSNDMARHGFIGHAGSNGLQAGDRATAAGYSWRAIGENVAGGYSDVEAVMQSWLESPGHCANIMNPDFADLGAAAVINPSSTYRVYWTQVFGRQR